MGLITKTQLTNFRNKTRFYSKPVNESLQEFKSESKYQKVTIFLSHKHDEIEELDSAISFLKQFDVEVYVDWLDEGMPKKTSGITAARIKMKIKENTKFIFLATQSAIDSKWCNWELGLGDADKYIKHIAILPIKDNYSDYKGNEYLEIYPYIYESDRTPGSFYLKNPDGRVIEVGTWLKS